MGGQLEKVPGLAALLRDHRDEIAFTWARSIHTLPGTRYRQYPLDEILSWASRGIDAVIETFATGSHQATEDYLIGLAEIRLTMGFDMSELIQGLWLLTDAALPLVRQTYAHDLEVASEVSAWLDRYMRLLVSRFAHLCAEVMNRDLRAQQRRIALLLKAVETVSSTVRQDEILKWIASGAASVLGLACTLCLLDAEHGTLTARASSCHLSDEDREVFPQLNVASHSDALVRALLELKGPVSHLDADADGRLGQLMVESLGFRPALIVPITSEDRVLGALICGTSAECLDISREDVDLIEGLSNAAGMAVQAAQLFEGTRRRLAETEGMQRVTVALLQHLTLDETLSIICSEACQLTAATGSTVLLLEDEEWLRVAHASGTPSPTSDRLPVRGSLAGLAMERREPLLVNDPRAVAMAQAYHAVPALETIVVAPLSVGAELIGALDVVNSPGGFTYEDLKIASHFAHVAAMAIHDARLHQQAEQLAVMEERQRLARELHDSVTQALYSVSLYAEAARLAMSAGKQEVAFSHLQEVQGMAREAMIDMRMLIFELHPPALEEEGFVAALEARLAAVETRAGLRTEFRVEGERRLPLSVEKELFWIAVEALNNAVKHAEAQRVGVLLQLNERGVCLEVADDGRGFDPARAKESGGMGLSGMEERVQRIKGTMDITSAPGKGTKLRVEAEV